MSKPFIRNCTLAFLAGMHSIAGAFSVGDGDFNPANWSATVTNTSGGASQTATQIAAGGNPGAHRQMTHTMPGLGNIVVAHQYTGTGTSYDPSTQGAIAYIDYSEDHIKIAPLAQGAAIGARPALLQNGIWYAGPSLNFTNTTWQTVNLNNLTANDFSNSGNNPDFSAAGSIIHFGYIRSNSNTGGNPSSTVSGIDNWSYAVTTATTVNLSAAPASPSVYGQVVTLTATVSGDAPTGAVQFKNNNTNLNCNGGNQVLDNNGLASCSLTGLNAGSYNFNAVYPGDANNAGATSNNVPYIINKADQTITGFSANPATGTVGGTATLSATASSGLPVSFGSGTPLICLVNGNSVTFLAAGNCILTADQAGNLNYNPAPQVILSMAVNGGASSVPTTGAWALALLSLMLLLGAGMKRRLG